jgi:AraC family transcriptional regulator of adaptative response/methylated-DNA-[protein]-cysteine methyltransferase
MTYRITGLDQSSPTTGLRLLCCENRKELTMATLASALHARRPEDVTNVARLNADTAWAAFMRRDRRWDGRVIGAVSTTGIYCKPSCPAKRPRREHVTFFATIEEARSAGYRACLRCRPDEVGRDREAVAKAVKLIEAAEEPLTLHQLAEAVGYAPHHFQRLFKRDLGVSPADYARGLRTKRAQSALKENGNVTDAIYDAGYSGPSGFYSDAKERLGMTPSAWRDGGRGQTIRWTTFDSPIGPMFIAATSRGICRLTFDDSEKSLTRLFPHATIVKDDGGLKKLVEGALKAIEHPGAMPDLPIDVAGTAFQEAVWRELRKIPPGETRSYAEIAAAIGQPKAVRAVGTANGDNHVAVLIPCHRVIRSDGTLGGYAGGLDKKRKLLAAEGHQSAAPELPLVE